MSTVKIKTEPTATAAAAVDVQVKLEPSFFTGKIKLEQHSSDIDIKVESDPETDSEVSEEDYIKSENDESDDSDEDSDQNQFTITPKNRQRFKCEYVGCGGSFSFISSLSMHKHEHKLQTDINIYRRTYALTRQSLDDRWRCPIPDCASTAKTANAVRSHIQIYHAEAIKQPLQHRQPSSQMTQRKYYFVDMDDIYVNGVRCGYHNTTGVFICYECKLVPECLLTHLQQKHGCDEKPIDNSALPESAVTANADPNINQHTSNPLLAAAISQPYWQHCQDIVQGWLCVTSDCGYCGKTVYNKSDHKKNVHQGEQITTVPALILRLVYVKTCTSCFLITRIDQVTTSRNRVNRHKFDYSRSGLSVQDECGDNVNQNETTDASNQRRQWKCEYSDCGRSFNSPDQLGVHRREHKLEVVINVKGMVVTLSRQSLGDRWLCPISECETTWKTADGTHKHILKAHSASLVKQKRSNDEDDDIQQQQKNIKRTHPSIYYLHMGNFYVDEVRCGYHKPTGVFICHECRLVPECLLTHLQQKHGHDKKSIYNSVLPESAVTASADPNVNQHTSNSHLASAISQPYRHHHQDIVRGWLCVTADCGHCCSTKGSRNNHQYKKHQGEQTSIVPALVLRLLYGKVQTSYFLITRLDTTTDSIKSSDSTSRHNSECYSEDDGDELVLSDYSDDNTIH